MNERVSEEPSCRSSSNTNESTETLVQLKANCPSSVSIMWVLVVLKYEFKKQSSV